MTETWQQRILQTAARWVAVTTVVAGAWLFAGAEPWAWLLLCQLANLAVALWLAGTVIGRPQPIRARYLTLALVLLIAFVAVQAAPLPGALVRTLNPHAANTTARSAEVLKSLKLSQVLTGQHHSSLVNFHLSLSASATRAALYLLAAYVAVFCVLANTTRRWRHIRRAAGAVVISCGVMAFFALMHKFSGSREVWWINVPRYGGQIFGPFTNRNHFALHMNLCVGLAVGLVLAAWRGDEIRRMGTWRARIGWLSSRRANRIILLSFAIALIGGSTCVSLSRGGITALVAALGAILLYAGLLNPELLGPLAAFVVRERPDEEGEAPGPAAPRRPSEGAPPAGARARERKVILLAVVLLIVAAVVWLGWGPVVRRLGTLGDVALDPMGDTRSKATLATLAVFGRCPVVGCGFGSFAHVFPYFQSYPAIQTGRYLHAHNDWAQLLAEGGLAGAALALAAALLLVRRLKRDFWLAGGRERLFIAGAALGLLALALHAFVDYGMHKPANGFMLAAVAAFPIAALYLRRERISLAALAANTSTIDHQPSTIDHRPSTIAHQPLTIAHRPSTLPPRAVALLFLVLTAALAALEWREFKGETACARFFYCRRVAEKCCDLPNLQSTVAGGCSEAALVLACRPADPDGIREVSGALYRWAQDPKLPRHCRIVVARRAFELAVLAVEVAPSDYLAWLWLGRIHWALGLWEEGQACLDRARELAAPGMNVRLFAKR